MNLGAIKTISKTIGKAAVKSGMKIRKISPELMLAGGIITGVAAVVTACVATKKTLEDQVIENAHKSLDDIQKNTDDSKEGIKEKKQKSFKVYRGMIFDFGKNYAMPAFLLILSIGLILGSHGVLKKRYVSTTLAYKALDEAFKDYRERVKEAVGKDKELHYFNGTHEGGEDTFIDENGETHTTKVAVKDKHKKNLPYEFDFNAYTAPGGWQSNSDYNYVFLRSSQNYMNDLLHSRGHVFLNEALDAIGLPRTPEGAVTGWLLGSGGDDFVDFGFSEYYTDEYSDAQDGYSHNIHLNFNVDGLIWDKI